MKDLRSALQQLDPKNPEHWTGDGLPKLDSAVLNKQFSRQQVTREAPLFNRNNLSFQLPPDDDGDDQVDGDPGEAAARESVFAMESSEFGGSEPTGTVGVAGPPGVEGPDGEDEPLTPPVSEVLADAKLTAEDALAGAHKAEDAAKKAVIAATAARDMIVNAQVQEYDPHASQRAVYDFLKSVQPQSGHHLKPAPVVPGKAPLVPGQSALDRAMNQRRQGRADQRPSIPLRGK